MELILAWVLLTPLQGILAYGITFAYFQREYPSLAKDHYREDKWRAAWFGCMQWCVPGVGLMFVFYLSDFGKHGLKFR